jgi:Na+/proline symporter
MLWTFFGYLGVLIIIGLVAKRYTADLDDYVLADRKMGSGPRRCRMR